MSGWTPKRVKEEMVRAFKVLDDTAGQIGPDWFKNNWPEYRVEFADEVGQHSQGTARTVTRVRVQHTARDISAMERVLLGHRSQPNWGAYVRSRPAALRTLVIWCFWNCAAAIPKWSANAAALPIRHFENGATRPPASSPIRSTQAASRNGDQSIRTANIAPLIATPAQKPIPMSRNPICLGGSWPPLSNFGTCLR
jgi:hypothetical protein